MQTNSAHADVARLANGSPQSEVWWLYHWSMTTDVVRLERQPTACSVGVTPGRASEMIVDQIRLLIRDGSLKPGDRLPAERELAKGSASAGDRPRGVAPASRPTAWS